MEIGEADIRGVVVASGVVHTVRIVPCGVVVVEYGCLVLLLLSIGGGVVLLRRSVVVVVE